MLMIEDLIAGVCERYIVLHWWTIGKCLVENLVIARILAKNDGLGGP